MSPQFILASKSPRRQELLRQQGYVFEVRAAEIPEQPRAGESPEAYALRIAREKAQVVLAASRLPVLGADTDVVLDGQILGKPRDQDDAVRMLLALSERRHLVYSAVAVGYGTRLETALSITEVFFGPLDAAQALAYWRSGEPADKAGAYAIQGLGARFVQKINGSYSGVVGLPIYETCQLLSQFGIHPA